MSTSKIKSLFSMHKGEPGTWKSSSCVTYPTPIWWGDMDGKINAIRIPAQKYGINLSDIEYETYVAENPDLKWNQLISKLESFQLNCKYKTINIDSVTSLADMINRGTIYAEYGLTNKGGKEKGLRIGGIPVNDMGHYKAESAAFSELIAVCKRIQEFNGTFINIIAHVVGERKIEDNSLSQSARIIITGGRTISGKIPAYCEETYHYIAERPANPDGAPDMACYTSHTGLDFARTILPLGQKLKLNDKNFFKEYIAPAISKANGEVK